MANKEADLERVRRFQEEITRCLQEGKLEATAVAEQLQHILEPMRDQRLGQARVLYDAGWGKALGFESFDAYLGSIPPMPPWPAPWAERFERIILVDARIPLTKMCELAGIEFIGDDETLVDFEPGKTREGVYWICCQDGRKNHNISTRDSRNVFARDEVGLTAAEGGALYVQDHAVLDGHSLLLPGSVLRRRGLVAYLRQGDLGPGFDWIWPGHADARFGAGSRGM